jgi:hypothetical protein
MRSARHQWPTPVILATQEAEIRWIVVRSQPKQIVHETLSRKYPTQKRAGRVTQVVECLPSKCEALSSHPTTTLPKSCEIRLQRQQESKNLQQKKEGHIKKKRGSVMTNNLKNIV